MGLGCFQVVWPEVNDVGELFCLGFTLVRQTAHELFEQNCIKKADVEHMYQR